MTKPTTEVDLSGFGYERIQHVGKGQYASAALVREISSGIQYVAKCISLAALNDHDQELANQEVILLQSLSNPHIVGYRDSFLIDASNTLVIVMEYCDGGDLRKLIKEKAKANEHFPEDQIMTWFVQLCLALQVCHSEKVLHRDLKTSNIFIADGNRTVKLGDFGISRILEGTTEAAVTIVGTPYYMSPEVCRSEPYNWKSDIWALGCVLYELCMLKHAFESSSLLGLVYKIVSDHYEPIPAHYSSELNNLICHLLQKSAEERPSINQVFANPYVKAYLAREAPILVAPEPSVPPPPPPPSRPRHAASLRPKPDKPKPPSPRPPLGAPAPPQGPPPLAPQSAVLLIASRIRRRLIGQKLNWLSAFAPFDSEGAGSLSSDELRNALTSMHLGIGDGEIVALVETLIPASGTKMSLDTFSTYMKDVPPEVKQYEAWARQVLIGPGRKVLELLKARDEARHGTLGPDVFRGTLRELVPTLTEQELDLLVLLADKNALGDIDYAEFASVFCPAPAPPPMAPAQFAPRMQTSPVGPPGMPPLSVGAPTAVPKGMPPLPGTAPMQSAPAPAPAPAPVDLGMTLTLNDVNAMTFFTCASRDLMGAAAARVSLSPEGCAIILSRIRRRLESAGVSITDVVALFAVPGERELTAEQWQEVATTLPLGTSRAEMQQLFYKVDVADTGRIQIGQLESLLGGASSSLCTEAPPYISAAMRRGLSVRVREDLHKLGGVSGASLARESDFKRVVMQTERYLTSDQLSSLLLLTDKNPQGLIDYQEFAERFGGGVPVLGVPGGLLPSSVSAWCATQAPASENEVRAVGSRTVVVMDRQGLALERLPALVMLWGGAVAASDMAKVLAILPLGLSFHEATALVQFAGGSLPNLAAQLDNLRSQGIWVQWCQWAAQSIPGPSLQVVLKQQVVEAECRTLDPQEFVRTLIDAGVKQPDTALALWLAEKTAQGDVCVAEFLSCFGGSALGEQKKKKRGLFPSFFRR